MAELLPLAQATAITHRLLDYLGTTFALADPDARRVLAEFLQHPRTGMFRGPYVRARLPFRPAAEAGATTWSGMRARHRTGIRPPRSPG